MVKEIWLPKTEVIYRWNITDINLHKILNFVRQSEQVISSPNIAMNLSIFLASWIMVPAIVLEKRIPTLLQNQTWGYANNTEAQFQKYHNNLKQELMSIKNKTGHLFAFIAVFIWSTTYVATKTLLLTYTPTDILIVRFFVAFLFLFVLYPRVSFPKSVKEELIFFGLGLTGVMLYFWLENLSLTYTYASNVGMIVSTIPLLAALISHFIFKDDVFEKKIFIGFLFAITGIFIVIFNGKMVIKLNPTGDFLALLAACVWAVFSNLLKLVNDKYHPILVIRKTFFYGIMWNCDTYCYFNLSGMI